MPKVTEPWAAASRLMWAARRSKEVDEGVGDTQTTQGPQTQGEEQMRIGARELATPKQVLV
jgi:hypothetical protein